MLAAIVETSLFGYAVMDTEFTFQYVSPSFGDLVGRAAASLVGTCALDLVHPDERDLAELGIIELLRPDNVSDDIGVPIVLRLVHGDGTVVTLEAGMVDQRHHPDIGGFVVRLRPMRGQEHLGAALRLLAQGAAPRRVLGELVLAIDGIVEDGRGLIAVREPRRHWHLPREIDPVLALDHPLPGGVLPQLWERAHQSGAREGASIEELEGPIAAMAQTAGYQSCWLIPVPDQGVEASIVVWRTKRCPPYTTALIQLEKVADVVGLALERHRSFRRLEYAARHDPLTGLLNRTAFHDRLTQVLAKSAKEQSDTVGLLFVDLDGFKSINDSHGHQAGDAVVVEMANRLREAVRGDDLVARLGGDEFAVICRRLATAAELDAVAGRVVAALARPMVLNDPSAVASSSGSTVQVGASVGGVLAGSEWTASHLDAGDDVGARLLVEADGAMYRAKRAGGARSNLHWVCDR